MRQAFGQLEYPTAPERIPQKRRREAAEIVGNLVIDGDALIIGPMGRTQRLADQRSTVAVPFGKCSNPQNVAAEGYGCPIRHQCFGYAPFSSAPSYLPEMRRRLLDLKAIRARIDAFHIAKIAAARKPLTLVYNGLRDGHIRAVTRQAAAWASRTQHARGRLIVGPPDLGIA